MKSGTATAAPSRRELVELIREAAAGDPARVERLIKPLLSGEERLQWAGPIAKLGIITTHNFGFVTDRRIGNLQVTPLTGTVHSTVCNLEHIDAFCLIQPAIPIRMWIVIGLLYLCTGSVLQFLAFAAWAFFCRLFRMYDLMYNAPVAFVLLGIWLSGPVVAHFVLRPGLLWIYLRLRKSGLWLKLQGTDAGVILLADRHQFGSLLALSRALMEQKRIVDREARL